MQGVEKVATIENCMAYLCSTLSVHHLFVYQQESQTPNFAAVLSQQLENRIVATAMELTECCF